MENSDNDFDGVGDNSDNDDDNDGVNDTDDIDPNNDLAIRFTFDWVELLDKQTSRSTAPFLFYIFQDSEIIHRFDDGNRPWTVPWQERFELNTEFELNVPDDIIIHQFTIIAMFQKFRNPEEFDIGDSNETFNASINYNIITGTWEKGSNGTLDGSLDKLLGSTFEFHQFQIEFKELSNDLFKALSKLPKVKNPCPMDG